MKRFFGLFLCLASLTGLFAQTEGIGINRTGNDPDPSAILDVQSESKGFLLPRMTTAQRNAISDPAPGLYIYNLDDACFNYYTGSEWVKDCGRSLDVDQASAERQHSPNNTRTSQVENGPDNTLYLTGNFTGQVTLGNLSLNQAGENTYLARFNPQTGEYLWAIPLLTGASLAGILEMSWDGEGNLYVMGRVRPGLHLLGTPVSWTGTQSYFIARIDPEGNLGWIYQPTSGTHVFTTIKADASGQVYFAGRYEGTNDFGGSSLTAVDVSDAMVGRLSNTGSLDFVIGGFVQTNGVIPGFGAMAPSSFSKIELGPSGNLYLTGTNTGSMQIGSVNLSAPASNNPGEGFLTKLTSSGTPLWTQSFESSVNSVNSDLTLDANGNAYVWGRFTDDLAVAGLSLTASGNTYHLLKLDTNGAGIWVNPVESPNPVVGRLIGDGQGNIFLTGHFDAALDVGGQTLTPNSSGQEDVFAAQYDANGTLGWTAQSAGAQGEFVLDAVYAPIGNLYLAGWFTSNPATFGDTQLNRSSTWSGFLWPINAQTGADGAQNSLTTSQDNDRDPSNELQSLNISGNTLSLSDGNSVVLPDGGDNLGDHTAATNLTMNDFWISGDGDDEGIFVGETGNIGIGISDPAQPLVIGREIANTTVATYTGSIISGSLTLVGGNNNLRLAIGFMSSQNVFLSSMQLDVSPLSPSVTSMLVYELGVGNDPNSGTIIYTDSIPFSSSGNASLQLPFSGSPAIQGGTTYYVIISLPGSGNPIYLSGGSQSDSPYSSSVWTSNSGGAFAAQSGIPNFSLFSVGQSTQVVVDSTGKVGIGTTAPQNALHLVGNLQIEDGSQQNGHVLTSDANGIASWQAPVVNTDEQTLVLSLNQLSISNGNSVDLSPINTDAQSLSLTGNSLSITNGNSVDLASILPGQDRLKDEDDDTRILVEKTPDEDQIRIEVKGSEVFRIDSLGKVGIGVFPPKERLDVNGGIRLGNTDSLHLGTIRYNGEDLEGYVDGRWKSLTVSDLNEIGTLGTDSIEVLDANQPDINGIQGGAFGFASNWQSFTISQTGILTRFQGVFDVTSSPATSNASFILYEGEGTTGNVLLTGPVPNNLPFFSWGTVFSGASVPVEKGQQYTLEIQGLVNTSMGWEPHWDNFAIHEGGRSDFGPNFDYKFRTYVKVPKNQVISFDEQAGAISLGRDFLNIDINGNVGIGTDEPDAPLHVVGGFKYEDGNQGNNKVLVSDANGVGSWKHTLSITGLTLTNGSQGLGKILVSDNNGLASWENTLSISGLTLTDGSEGLGKILVSDGNGQAGWTDSLSLSTFRFEDGNQQEGYLLASDSNGNAYWRPDALVRGTDGWTYNLRASLSKTNVADDPGDPRGEHSVDLQSLRFSSDQVASGLYATIAGGAQNSSTNIASTVGGGVNNDATASQSTVAGGGANTSSGASSTVGGGEFGVAAGNYSTIPGGRWLRADSYAETVVGTFNIASAGSPGSWVGDQPLFVIGNGTADNARSNAMTILKNGAVGIGTSTPQSKLDVHGDVDIAGDIVITSSGGTVLETGNNYVKMDKQVIVGTGPSGGNFTFTAKGPSNFEQNVSIGTFAPASRARLDITGGQTHDLGLSGFLNSSGATGQIDPPSNVSYSIYADDMITGLGFYAHSDKRIKQVEGQSDSEADLSTLMQIEVTDYRLRDSLTKGNRPIKKVIAQQVAEVYPQAVTTNLTEVVPDIYQRAELQDGWIMLATDLKVGERVKLITEQSSEVFEVLETESTRFKVSLRSLSLSKGRSVFVYGREVNDFHTVDYEALSMLNVSATQAQQQIIEAQQLEIKSQKTQIESQQSQIESLQSQLNALKSLQSEQNRVLEELTALKTMLSSQPQP